MGNTFTVVVWTRLDVGFWSGESLLAALWNLWRAKRQGFGCVKLEWR